MNVLNLNGKWKVSGAGYKELDASVPGCIHTDLMNAGIIPDPYYRDNEKKLMWIGETDWEYTRSFNIDSSFLQKRNILLCCHGLDTLASIYINGKLVGKADNMFRKWMFDVKEYLVEGENSIIIKFASTVPYIAEKNSRRHLYPAGLPMPDRVYGSNLVRKMQCNYGWDWGPKCVTCGIWKDIEFKAFDIAGISDVVVSQKVEGNEAVIKIKTELYDIPARGINAIARASFKGIDEAEAQCGIKGKTAELELVIKNPGLWWPNNMGEQNLYDIEIELMDNGTVIDKCRRRTGIRSLRLERLPDEWGESFCFSVNGVPFFAKGANWIPADTFVTRISGNCYRHLISEAANANMNFLRVWGGGIYESDMFYDLCDEYGICIWQDFMFACSAYPAYDPDFMENVKNEAGRKHILFLEFGSGSGVASDNAVYFVRPKHIELENPGLRAEVVESDGKNHRVTIAAAKPALWVWTDIAGTNASYSDRFFHMFPGKPVTITITTENKTDADDIAERLEVHSLVDTF